MSTCPLLSLTGSVSVRWSVCFLSVRPCLSLCRCLCLSVGLFSVFLCDILRIYMPDSPSLLFCPCLLVCVCLPHYCACILLSHTLFLSLCQSLHVSAWLRADPSVCLPVCLSMSVRLYHCQFICLLSARLRLPVCLAISTCFSLTHIMSVGSCLSLTFWP